MNNYEVAGCFEKGLETFKAPNMEISNGTRENISDWIITDWNGNKIYVILIGQDCIEPTFDIQQAAAEKYGCGRIVLCSTWQDIKDLLEPIYEEIDIKSGDRRLRELSGEVQREKEAMEHEAALQRKAERQEKAELRRMEQLERARLYHLKHDNPKD